MKNPTYKQIEAAKGVLLKAGYVCVRSIFQKDDIIERAKDREIELTDKQVQDIANFMERKHDANQGVNWDFIDYCTDEILES